MDLSKIKESIFLAKEEEIIAALSCKFETTKTVVQKFLAEKRVAIFWKTKTQISQNVEKPVVVGGHLVLTNNRLMFLQEAGFIFKETKMLLSIPLQNITNVSIGGMIIKHLNVGAEMEGNTQTFRFQSQNSETFMKKISEQRNKIKEQEVIKAKKVVIEEKPEEKPMEVLQRRLAKGEITLEEFHEKVQRM